MSARDVIANLRALAARTSDAHGAQRVAWGPVWRDARRWLDGVLAEAGLRAEPDIAGNNWITVPGARPDTVIIGGHLDSVPNGGWLDGPLGILAGIEALRRFNGSIPPVTLAVVDFADEEGARFSRSLLGSSGASGSLVPDSVRDLVDRQGVRLAEALAENGVDLDRMPEARRALDQRHPRAYLELHIEQGPVLEAMGRSTGAVIGTYGVERHVLRFVGQAAHSGSTPIAMRRDAFLAAAETALACREIARRHSTPATGMVCTVGTVSVEPAIVTAVPGVCEIALDQRALEPDTLRRALADAHEAASRAAAANGVTVTWRHLWRIDPCRFDPRLVDLCADAVQEATGHAPRLPSGPLHDAVEMGRVMPAVMMFASSTNGLSHCKEEDTPEADLEVTIDAFLRLVDKTVAAVAADTRPASRCGRETIRPILPSASRDRRGVVGLLVLLFAITYLDRVCISVAGPRMQEDLGIDPIGWGWVTGMFTLAYCLFEIPTGMMGDRIGPRRVLTRIVVWWSAFTALTGAVTSYYPLLLTRFLFGAGEAGAFPNASVVVSRWFPPRQRATMQRREPDGQPGGRRHRAAPGAADSDALRLADVVLRIRRGRAGLGGGLVRVVPRFARREARARCATLHRHRSLVHFSGPFLPLARGLPVQDSVVASRIGVLLRLRLHLLPDVVSYVPRPGSWIQRGQPAPVGAPVRGRRVRQRRRWRRERRAGAAIRCEARPTSHWRHCADGRGDVHRGGHAHAPSVAHGGLPRPDLRRNHLPTVRGVRGLPGHRRSAGRSDGRPDEHDRPSRRTRGLGPLRLHRGSVLAATTRRSSR